MTRGRRAAYQLTYTRTDQDKGRRVELNTTASRSHILC